MRATIEVYIGPDQRSGSNRHGAGIDQDAVEVDVDVLAKDEVVAVVGKDGRVYPGFVYEQRIVGFTGLCWGRQWGRISSDAGGLSIGEYIRTSHSRNTLPP